MVAMTDPDTPRQRGRASAYTTTTVGDRLRAWHAARPKAVGAAARLVEVAGWIAVYVLVRWLGG